MLGKLACPVLSRILGIVMANRNWKQAMKVKKGICAKIGGSKTSKQIMFFCTTYQMMSGTLHRTVLLLADRLCNDNNFSSMKMDAYCMELEARVGAVDNSIQATRIVRLWREKWEAQKQAVVTGHEQLMTCLEEKYIGLKLNEIEDQL